ncbi:MAG: ubiquinone biosynthesis accessory factor UbiJ [Legionella sp.]
MIKQYTLKMLERTLNHGLSLDQSISSKLALLHGKVLQIIITPLNIHFFVIFEQHRLILLTDYSGIVDTTILSSPLGLIRLSILPASKARSVFNDDITITGDIELGQHVKRMVDQLDIDWEGHLARFTGDMVAHQVGSIFRSGFSYTRKINQSLQKNLTEYLQEEARMVPSREELNDLFHDIDTLSLDTERLSAYIEQLTIAYETH